MPNAVRVVLSRSQHLQLMRVRNRSRDWQERRRATALLMAARGRPVKLICEATGYERTAVTRLKNCWNEVGMAAIFPRPSPGRPPKADEEYRERLEEAARASPQELGYAFTTWSIARLAAHMESSTGVRLCEERVRVWLHRLGFSFRKPSHTLANKRNARAHARALRLLRGLKKGPAVTARVTNSGSATRPTSISCPT